MEHMLKRPARSHQDKVMYQYQFVGYYVTRQRASCGILWYRRTPQCRRRTRKKWSLQHEIQ